MYGDLSEIQITRFSKAYKLKGKYKPKLGFSEERGAGKGGVQEGGGGGGSRRVSNSKTSVKGAWIFSETIHLAFFQN